MKKINWGIIGLGKVANKFADGFRYSPNANLLAISSLNNVKLKKFQKIRKDKLNFIKASWQ